MLLRQEDCSQLNYSLQMNEIRYKRVDLNNTYNKLTKNILSGELGILRLWHLSGKLGLAVVLFASEIGNYCFYLFSPSAGTFLLIEYHQLGLFYLTLSDKSYFLRLT